MKVGDVVRVRPSATNQFDRDFSGRPFLITFFHAETGGHCRHFLIISLHEDALWIPPCREYRDTAAGFGWCFYEDELVLDTFMTAAKEACE